MEEISFMCKTDAIHICTMLENHIFILPPFPKESEREGAAKYLLTASTQIVVILTALGILYCI